MAVGPSLFFFSFFFLFPLISSTLLTDVSVPGKKKKKLTFLRPLLIPLGCHRGRTMGPPLKLHQSGKLQDTEQKRVSPLFRG